ncbi:MAG: large subunit ribosomal protein [Patescibacteria group bacterium]|nr:large subunit ribosomal protein [Patescibacteria group bacterium]
MSDQDITLTLQNREAVGKAVKQLRRDGQVPAVIHDHGKASIHVMAPYVELYKVYQQAGKHAPVHLTVGGKKYLAIIRDADFEPRKNRLQHIVFNAIEQNKPVETEVPVVFQGDPEAEKVGFMLLRQIDNVEVKALPKDLPDEVVIDVSGLTVVGDRLHVSDIVVPAGVTILTEPEHAVVMVEEPRSLAAQQAEEDEAAAAAAEAQAPAEEDGDAKAKSSDEEE